MTKTNVEITQKMRDSLDSLNQLSTPQQFDEISDILAEKLDLFDSNAPE